MKIRRPCTKWNNVIEEDLSIIGVKKTQAIARRSSRMEEWCWKPSFKNGI
jgi:hypothetical protein